MFIDERLVLLFKQNCQHTLTYWSVFFSFGLCIAFLGPTVLDLKCQTNSTLQEITWVFFSQQFCLLIGSSIGGVFKKTLFSALAALLLSSLVISLVFAIIPLCYNVLLLAVAMAVSGLAMGIIDTIANIQLVSLYQKDSAIFLQALHFFIGFGALVSPLIADPFLAEHCPGTNSTEDEAVIMHHVRHSMAAAFRSSIPLNYSQHLGPITGQSSVSFAFWIMALINLPVPIAVFVLMYKEKLIPFCYNGSSHLLEKDELAMETRTPETAEASEHDAGGHGDLFSCCMNSNFRELPASFFGVHILGGIVLFMTDGIVGAYAGFAYTYAVSPPMLLHHKTAGYLPCVFWAAITGGRLLSIPLAYRLRPVYLLIISLAGVIVTVLLLLIFYTSSLFLFIGTCLLGLFLSSIFPCMLAYTEDILDYQGCATTVLVTSAGMGEMVLQVLVGSIIQTTGSYSFLLCGMITGFIGFVFFFGLMLCHRLHRNYLRRTSKKTAMVEDPAPVPSPLSVSNPVPVSAPKPAPSTGPISATEAAPSKVPGPVPKAVPEPAPSPLPALSPALSPVPSPLPASSPVPSPLPALSPASSPVPSPLPALSPAPSPLPALSTAPSPLPALSPGSSPAPSPLPAISPASSPAPSPLPALSPASSPVPSPFPALSPAPSPLPALSPASSPVPLPLRVSEPALSPDPLPLPALLPVSSPAPSPRQEPVLEVAPKKAEEMQWL
ncbi:major facilitator superfamily domain-containing protein 4B isoform X1 [Astyanax mexicanus]|uniref:major facilitator superfamily domain-containing protein 4B isoform X1 n=1 Tax=Astyanax mexicanus TaxID=7994 RepID=UPI0020CB6111|nr:major facilitator superfamily domain-containing protein 4B isoform X1 [Astyanax mexicanus]